MSVEKLIKNNDWLSIQVKALAANSTVLLPIPPAKEYQIFGNLLDILYL
jgi:hypothetical protein